MSIGTITLPQIPSSSLCSHPAQFQPSPAHHSPVLRVIGRRELDGRQRTDQSRDQTPDLPVEALIGRLRVT